MHSLPHGYTHTLPHGHTCTQDVVGALLQCAQRHQNHDHAKVQISAFEAINDLVRSASRDTLEVRCTTCSALSLDACVHVQRVKAHVGRGSCGSLDGGLKAVESSIHLLLTSCIRGSHCKTRWMQV